MGEARSGTIRGDFDKSFKMFPTRTSSSNFLNMCCADSFVPKNGQWDPSPEVFDFTKVVMKYLKTI